jgi:PAS domain S-box-containing protein
MSKGPYLRVRLRTRLILYSTVVLFILMGLVFLVMEKRQSEMIEDEAKLRGMAIARNLAAVSTAALLTYNYVALEQNAEKTALEGDISYVIIHDKENRVAAYSRHYERQGMVLDDEVSRKAVAASDSLIQLTLSGENKGQILDISVPVFIKESTEKWGTIRVGLSLNRMFHQIGKTQIDLFHLGLLALVFGILGSIYFTRRITKPILALVEGTISTAQGNFGQRIHIHTGDEIEELGKNFNDMIDQIRRHQNSLEARIQEITALKAYNDNILSSMTNGLIAVDLDERVVTVNEPAERILEIKKADAVGHSLDSVLGSYRPLYEMVSKSLSTEKESTHPELYLKKEEKILCLAASASLLTSGDGKKIGALALFQDVTELKTLEEKLRQSDRLASLGTLSAGLAHEIKNPLSAIKTFVQLLPQKSGTRTFMEKFNVTVPREIDRINQLVEDLLELTRTRKKPWVSVDINALLGQVMDLHHEELKKKQITLEADLDRRLPQIQGDSDKIYRAFSNLVINSIQAMPEGGVLSVSSIREDSRPPRVRVSLRDTGIGMDATSSKNLFSLFFTTKERGVGLGMALTRKVVEDHHGSIEVFSEPGKGTTFVLKFPVVDIYSCTQS